MKKSAKRHSLSRRTKYRIALVNENRLKRVWSLRLSRFGATMLAVLAAVGVLGVIAIVISLTPLRSTVFRSGSNVDPRELADAQQRIDSLNLVVARNDLYIANINNVLSFGLDIDSLRDIHFDETALLTGHIDFVPVDTTALLPTSDEERQFVADYTLHEGFSIEAAMKVLPEAPAFVAPLHDAIVVPSGRTGEPVYDVGSSAVGVYTIARGNVVSLHRSGDNVWELLVQHPDGYLSRYRSLDEVYVKEGQTLTSGQKIGRYTPSATQPFDFSLFRDGTHLNPFQYIRF